MAKIRLIGLTSIRTANIKSNVVMNTDSLSTITAIVPDSAHMIIEPPAVSDLFVEEEDLPDIQILGSSKKTIEFATRDMGSDVLVKAFGGATAGAVWSMATSGAVTIKQKCIEAVSKTYNGKKLKVEIPRVSVRNGGDLRFTKTESGQINWSCDVLIPLPLTDGIKTSTLGVGGSGYAVGNTFTVNTGTTLATGKVLTVATGVVETYEILTPGSGYTVADGVATTATSGSGTGLTIDITVLQDTPTSPMKITQV